MRRWIKLTHPHPHTHNSSSTHIEPCKHHLVSYPFPFASLLVIWFKNNESKRSSTALMCVSLPSPIPSALLHIMTCVFSPVSSTLPSSLSVCVSGNVNLTFFCALPVSGKGSKVKLENVCYTALLLGTSAPPSLTLQPLFAINRQFINFYAACVS